MCVRRGGEREAVFRPPSAAHENKGPDIAVRALSITNAAHAYPEGAGAVPIRGTTTRGRPCGGQRDERRHRGGLHRLGDLGLGLRAVDVAHLRGEALLERPIDLLLDLERLLPHHFRHLGDDERLGAVEHPLLAERQALRLAEEREALEDVGHVVDRAGPHLVGVVLEAALPVLVVVDLAVAEQREESIDFRVLDGLAQADAVNVGDRHQHCRVVRDDPQVEEPAGRSQNGFFFDSFYDAEPMIRVNDLVSDLECHVSLVQVGCSGLGS